MPTTPLPPDALAERLQALRLRHGLPTEPAQEQEPPAPAKVASTKRSLSPGRVTRLVATSAEISGEAAEEIGFQHVVLAHLGFPRSATDERIFERRSGTALLRIRAGELYDGQNLVPQPMPYGAIPRLVMIAAITRAVQTQTRRIELGTSMTDSLRNLGLASNGAANWANVNKQLNALAAVDLVLGYEVNNLPRTIKATPFTQITAWVHRSPNQRSLFPTEITLSEDFFSALKGHSVPLDLRAVRELSRFATALDVYSWLAHRLYRVRDPKGESLSWAALRQQFGQEISSASEFCKVMRSALQRVQLVYPKGRWSIGRTGMVLYCSPPPIAATQVVVAFPGQRAEGEAQA